VVWLDLLVRGEGSSSRRRKGNLLEGSPPGKARCQFEERDQAVGGIYHMRGSQKAAYFPL